MQTGELSTSTLWSRGPSWLNTKKNWPSWNSKSVLLQSTAAEQLEAISTFTSESTNNPTNVPEPKHGIAKIINLSAHSNLHKLVRVTAWLLRFVDNLKKRTHSGPLSVTELDSALMFWIVDCQSVVYSTYSRRHLTDYPWSDNFVYFSPKASSAVVEEYIMLLFKNLLSSPFSSHETITLHS